MSDLLDLLGDEWALPDEDEPTARGCKHRDRDLVTHGCRESGRVPSVWSDIGAAGYVDGMGRPTKCSYCSACIGSGRVHIRDAWTDQIIPRSAANCVYCDGTGWHGHAWDCDGTWHAWALPVHEPIPATSFGIAFPRRTVIPGEYALVVAAVA